MATGVMRNVPLRAPSPAYFPPEEDEEDEEEEEKGSTDEDDASVSSDRHQDATERLLRFADAISRDVRRYFGRREDEDGADAPRHEDRADEGHPASELGPLAELFESRGKGQGRPMNARHLPLSFWTEPDPLDGGGAPRDQRTDFGLHALENAQPDFSDLLANWDPNPGDTDLLH
ncbi:protein PERCC1 [Festucalex cinctus]